MAWETPEYACGHYGEREQMYGPMRGREARLEAYKRQVCPDCRKAEADKLAEVAGLPLLSGSPKQIAWASEIRERALRLLPPERAEKLRVEKSAKWWIDHRSEVQHA